MFFVYITYLSASTVPLGQTQTWEKIGVQRLNIRKLVQARFNVQLVTKAQMHRSQILQDGYNRKILQNC
jgi:hypothetical protein